MGIRERLSGNEAIAYAMKQINPDVMGAFPITPSTEIPQYFAAYVDNGQVDTEFIAVESEHSAMSTCIGAEAAGCRAISATSSCGLCYMTEMLYVAASDRLPITLAVSTRNAPGIAEAMRYHSLSITPRGMLSRGVSVLRGKTLIVNLPGSPKAVQENLEYILPSLEHGVRIAAGLDGECARK